MFKRKRNAATAQSIVVVPSAGIMPRTIPSEMQNASRSGDIPVLRNLSSFSFILSKGHPFYGLQIAQADNSLQDNYNLY